MTTKHLDLTVSELNTIMGALASYISSCHDSGYKTLASTSQSLYDRLYDVQTPRPAPVVPSDDGDGASLERHYSRYESLKETVPVLDDDIPPIFKNSSLCPFCGSTFYRDDLGSCYDCFFPSDDRGE